MTLQVRIDNGVANVIRFIAIEMLLAWVIEPAVAEINRVRAQRIAASGNTVRIRTGFVRRDFSGPVIGGKLGVAWKIVFLMGIIASLLAMEFAFDYGTRTREKGSTISLTGLSDVSEGDFIAGDEFEKLSETIFKMVECSYHEGNLTHERRLRPGGACYFGGSVGLTFPKPCVLSATEAETASCERTEDGIIKGTTAGGFTNSDYTEMIQSSAEYVVLTPAGIDDNAFQGRRGEDGVHVRYCSRLLGPSGWHTCLEYLDSGDGVISMYTGDIRDASLASDVRPVIASTPVIRIGSDTFNEAGCSGCALRIRLIVDYVATAIASEQNFVGIRANLEDSGTLVAMLAMGLPAEVYQGVDDEDVESIGYLIIDWRLAIPFVLVVIAALLIKILGLCVRRLINVPLDYASAMYAAYDREVGGGDCNATRLKTVYTLGLVETSVPNALHLSLDAKQAVPYKGEEIRRSDKTSSWVKEAFRLGSRSRMQAHGTRILQPKVTTDTSARTRGV